MAKINKAISKIFKADQADRKRKNPEWEEITQRDTIRRKELTKILNNKTAKLSGEDYFMSAIVFQHGRSIKDSKTAIALARKGMKLGNERSKWIYAAAIDRLLMKQNKKQKYGTQYRKGAKGWFLYPVQKRTTDSERAKFNIEPLKKAKARAKELNKRDKVK